MTTNETIRRDIDAGDIQAIARSGFGPLKAARYMLLRVAEADTARQWLRLQCGIFDCGQLLIREVIG